MQLTREQTKIWAFAIAALAIFAYLFVATSPARSASPELLWHVPEAGSDQSSSGAGKLLVPKAVAASPVDGHVFVSEPANARISEFTSWGQFVMAFGWGVRDGNEELQTCTAATGCRAGNRGSGAGQFFGPVSGPAAGGAVGLAVDPSGNLWAEERFEEAPAQNFRVQKFSPSGEFILAIGREVDKTSGGNICTAASGDTCGNGLPGSGQNEFGNTAPRNEFHDAIDAAADGTVYVGDVGRVEAIKADGSFKEEVTLQGKLTGSGITSLAINPAGGFYLVPASLDAVWKVDSVGLEVGTLIEVEPINESLYGLATDVAGNVYLIDHFHNVFVFRERYEVLEFDDKGVCTICAGDEFATPPIDPTKNTVSALWGVAVNALGPGVPNVGDIYVSSGWAGFPSYIAAYGPNPRFEPAPPAPPEVRGGFAASVNATSAAVGAEINPHFSTGTTYVVEYGLADCSLGACESSAPLSLGADRNKFARTNEVELGPLQSGTTYHYRFVATSGSFVVPGEDRVFSTRQGSTALLPDGRGYELVSPANKNNGEVGAPESLAAISPDQATPTGEAITYTSLSAFGEHPQSATGGSQYVSRRTPGGWTTENITPPDQEGFIAAPVQAFSEDLSTAALGVKQPPLTPDAPLGVENLYLRDSASKAISLLSGGLAFRSKNYCVEIEGASADFSRVFFAASGVLTPGAPASEGFSLYEWSAAGGVRLVSVLPNGKPAAPDFRTNFGGSENNEACQLRLMNLRNAISADGSRAFWRRQIDNVTFQLYARVNGNETVQIDKAQGGGGPSGNGRFWTASRDGSIAFFTAPGKLISGVGTGALYRYDFNAEEGHRLSALTPGPADAEVPGILGASQDGKRVYFIAHSALTSSAVTGENNLYLWEAGVGLRFIAILDGGDNSDWDSVLELQTARTNPDGSAVTFKSIRPLTGFDNVDQSSGERDPEVFLYSASSGRLSCVSCSATGARPIGPSSLPIWSRPFQQPRYLSDSGERLFFMTKDALDLHDVNRAQDVYEFERIGVGSCTTQLPTYSPEAEGCTSLISPGTQKAPATLIDASADGNDVFIGTPQRLVGQDVDEAYDLYDARVGGGFPPPPPAAPQCSGDSCRIPGKAPSLTSPGSSVLEGPGNVSNKAKHHKKKHHKKKHHKKKHHKKQGKHQKKAGRTAR